MRIADYRKIVLGLTQEQLAQKIGCTKQTIIRIEKGFKPSIKTAAKMKKALNLSSEDLLNLLEE